MREISEHELDRTLREEERLVLVFFWHERCEPCRELRRELEDLGEEVCLALSLDAGQHAAAAARHRVLEFPTVVFFKRGAELHRFRGGALPPSTVALLGWRGPPGPQGERSRGPSTHARRCTERAGPRRRRRPRRG